MNGPGMSTTATSDDARLEELRAQIDAVDRELLDGLNRRARLVQGVAAWKHERRLPLYVPDRERAVIERLQAASAGPFPADAIRTVFSEIMSACLSLEQRLQVAYLGPEATFTHQASRVRFGLAATYVPSATIAGVFSEVEKGHADLGVVPVENSAEGVVSHTLDVFVDSDLVIADEIVLEVSHCLLARAPSLEGIAKVYSHPQALAQCRAWLAAHLPGRPLVEVASTALAARLAKDDPHAAAVASALAGRLYDLRVVESHIEDAATNVTRFLVVRKGDGSLPAPSGHDRTTLLLALKDSPGALHHALAPFATEGLNLSRIESRPSKRRAWQYVFFVDVDGHVADAAMTRALDGARLHCAQLKILGCYSRADSGADG